MYLKGGGFDLFPDLERVRELVQVVIIVPRHPLPDARLPGDRAASQVARVNLVVEVRLLPMGANSDYC
jgi:hypothetical protein